ncbi:hypothetical protein PPTG_04405 [Phytophthora nicotianae INRA-310]|uniref:Vacuolar protein sorting-associated protein 26 n=1 Tax=Phytophthora nicotianae (strain INRA-310) TaxID=761204 RepID=W2R135_PHYN3|nr:hypothetical protein PPTG_04405 [Phytophthora nicotianae INRA-310]ETN18971.1 hypothetical protein PPTG_04405 [Phytophthora nicotianae INRA-310]
MPASSSQTQYESCNPAGESWKGNTLLRSTLPKWKNPMKVTMAKVSNSDMCCVPRWQEETTPVISCKSKISGCNVWLPRHLWIDLSRWKWASRTVYTSSSSTTNPGKWQKQNVMKNVFFFNLNFLSSRYHLKDVVIGKIFFLLVRIKIKHMELAILRRESVGSGAQRHSESETVTKFEIMDGAPVKGESVPVRLYLAPYALTPTYRNVQSRFSVKYFLNLVLVDEEDRRYFKQQEITLWRKNFG